MQCKFIEGLKKSAYSSKATQGCYAIACAAEAIQLVIA